MFVSGNPDIYLADTFVAAETGLHSTFLAHSLARSSASV
jgi:hypothetical protein